MATHNLNESDDAWRTLLIDDADGITQILSAMRRIAVLGMKPEAVGGPAYTVPAFLDHKGYDIVPVPVYYPEVTEILGKPVHRTLRTLSPRADVIQVFRRAEDIPQHLNEMIAAQPDVVWMQLGIRNDAVAETLARAGIRVVQNKCIEVELNRRRAR